VEIIQPAHAHTQNPSPDQTSQSLCLPDCRHDPGAFDRVWPVIAHKFPLNPDNRRRNPFCQKIHQQVKETHNRLSDRAKEREEKKRVVSETVDTQTHDTPQGGEHHASILFSSPSLNQKGVCKGGGKYTQEFLAFWAEYPKKKAKGDAFRAWKKAKKEASADEILAGLQKAKKDPGWNKDGGRYIPHSATWLNGSGWEDEVGSDIGPPVLTEKELAEHNRRIQERNAREPAG